MKTAKGDKEKERFLGYTKLAIVGKGAFGTAILYKRESDNKDVVIKEVNIMNMPLEEKKSALNEVKVLSALNHPHIIRYFGSFEKDGSLFIEMEYADGGTLAQFLDVRIQEKKRIKEQDVLFLFRQITGAIGYMHQHKILHRDLKTANIFLTKQFICKVGDFGISKMMNTLVQAQTVVGTPYYLSPEMCEGKDYDEKSDIWALGCILYEMAELRKPFEALNLPALVTKITSCEFEPISRKYSSSLQQLINSVLQKNSSQRPSAQTIHACIIPQMLQELNEKETENMVLNNRRILTERSVLYEMKCFKDEFSLVPVKLPTCKLHNVAVGSNHCLAVTEDALVYSWGDNRCGQLGLGELAPWRNFPIRIDSLTGKNIKQVSAGCGYSIFLNNIGLLMSCGDGRQGCLGHGDWNSITQPRIINRMISVNIAQVKSGPDHVMTLSVNGDIYSWGCGKSGRLGLGDEESRCSPTFVKIPPGCRVKKIFCGGDASIALTSTGQLLACGLNTNNKLGLSSTFQHQEKALNFTLVRSIKCKIKDVSMGNYHTILITEDGNAITMGRNNEGQLGRGHCKPRAQPEEMSALKHKIMVADCGSSYSIAGTMDNVVYFWGTRYKIDSRKSRMSTASSTTNDSAKPLKQSFFKMAEGSFSSNSSSVSFSSDIVKNCDMELIKTPKAVLGCSPTFVKIPPGCRVKKIFCGGDASIALTSTGQLLACGLNTNNKLGLSSTFQHQEKALNFTLVRSIKCKIKDVSMGNYHTILITEDGNAITMGRNNEGQLGRGHCKPRAQPEEMSALKHKIMVADCGSSYSIAGTMDNVVYFWGTRYKIDSRKSRMSTASSTTNDSAKPLKQSFFKMAEGSFSSNSSSVSFSSDIVKNCDMELIKTPKAVLGLYASPQHIAAGELVWLVNVFSFDSSIFVWVDTTVPAPTNEIQDNSSINQEMVSRWMDFETLKRELTALPNTPQPT